MPRMVSEISQGQTFDYSVEENKPSLSSTRIFRILKTHPGETVNLAAACGVFIGDEHPRVPGIFCYHYSGAFEGDSRMVILATFDYRLTAGSDQDRDPNQDPPNIRPANWYTTTSLVEVPAYQWSRVTALDGTFGPKTAIENPAGDLYEGVTRLEPIVTIAIEQWEYSDPTRHVMHTGKTNSVQMTVGTLVIPKRCLMFRGVTSKPATENWGNQVWRGWLCSYEFLFKRNTAKAVYGGVESETDIGWDILQPVSGFNVKAFTPPGTAQQEPYGQPLRWDDEGKVVTPLALPNDPPIAAGDKVRAHVKIGIKGGFTGQRPSAQPVPLNDDGTPRKDTANPKVFVYRYKVTEEMNFADLGLRLG